MLWAMLQRTAAANPGRPAFEDANGPITFEKLVEDAERLAGRLADSGIAEGDRVAVIRRNGVDLARILCSVLARGATAVPLSPLLNPPEIERCLVPTRPRFAFLEEGAAPGVVEALTRSGVPSPNVFQGPSERFMRAARHPAPPRAPERARSEEHTSELQSLRHLVCRL